MKFTPIAISTLLMSVMLSSCYEEETAPTTDDIESKKTEELVAEAARQTGLPNITNFTEKHFAKMIYELRDSEISTYSYFMDMQGRLHFLCESIGYGLPFSVQYVNPERIVVNERSGTYGSLYGTLPQPEPNGLFMPDGLSATWILCSDGEGSVKPVYSEPELIVSPFPLQHATDLGGGKD